MMDVPKRVNSVRGSMRPEVGRVRWVGADPAERGVKKEREFYGDTVAAE